MNLCARFTVSLPLCVSIIAVYDGYVVVFEPWASQQALPIYPAHVFNVLSSLAGFSRL